MSKENIIVTQIGSEISVKVYFDYQEEVAETRDDPMVHSEVIINSVSTGANGTDILECLNDEWLQILEDRCEQDYMATALAEYEMSQEES